MRDRVRIPFEELAVNEKVGRVETRIHSATVVVNECLVSALLWMRGKR